MNQESQPPHPQQLAENRLRHPPQAIFHNHLIINNLRITHKIYQLFLIPL